MKKKKAACKSCNGIGTLPGGIGNAKCDRCAGSGAEFFDVPSPLDERETRREAIKDYAENVSIEADCLADAARDGDLVRLRTHWEELRDWMEALDDNVCKRDENGDRSK